MRSLQNNDAKRDYIDPVYEDSRQERKWLVLIMMPAVILGFCTLLQVPNWSGFISKDFESLSEIRDDYDFILFSGALQCFHDS